MSGAEHGTVNAYMHHKCRCDECTRVGSEYFKRRRAIKHQTLLADDDPRHGTTNLYTVYGCRCQPCRDAHAVRMRAYKDRARSSGMEPGDPRHGTSNGYSNQGCRCRLCVDVWTRYNRDLRASKRAEKPGGVVLYLLDGDQTEVTA